jgi:N-acetylneuraminic acid mutarotase
LINFDAARTLFALAVLQCQMKFRQSYSLAPVMKKVRPFYVFFLCVLSLALSCREEELTTRLHPDIDTKPVTDITANGAVLNGKVLNTGELPVKDFGFVYDDAILPTLESSDRISLGAVFGKGPFSAVVNRNLRKDATYYVRAYAIGAKEDFIVYGQGVKFISLGGSVPEIKQFLPTIGVIGDTILVSGTGFSNVPVNNKLSIGTVRAPTIKSNEDSLWCVVGISTEVGNNKIFLEVGQYKIEAEESFLLSPMVLNSFSADSVTFGDTVVVSGSNFPRTRAMIQTTLLGKDGMVVAASPTVVKAIVADDVTLSSAPIRIGAGVQSLTSSAPINLIKPQVKSFSPDRGTKGTEVMITGDYFCPLVASNKVHINGIDIPVLAATRTSLTARIPPDISPGKYPIEVSVLDQRRSTTALFEIIKPIITAVAPLHGTWGTTVTITGENFGAGIADNQVMFGTVPASIISASSSAIQVKVPDNLLTASAAITVVATSVDNQTATWETPFMLDAPLISGFSPAQGKADETVTISGANFNPVVQNQIVTFGEFAARVISATNNELVVQLPAPVVDSDVTIDVQVAEQHVVAETPFHLISPWRKIADYPESPAGAVAFTIGNYGYVTLGVLPGIVTKKTWRYDPAINQWSQVADFSFVGTGSLTAYVGCTGFAIDGFAYAGLGLMSGAGTSLFSKYDPAGDVWTKAAPIPTYRGASGRAYSVSYNINGKGYVALGVHNYNQPDSLLEEYDPATNTWQRKKDFAGAARINASAFSIGSKGYVSCGSGFYPTYYYNDLWEYDATLDTWTPLQSLPGSARYYATTFALNGMGYLLGGTDERSIFSDFWMYDPGNNQWSPLGKFPGTARAAAFAFVIGNKAYIGTGRGAAGTLKDCWEFDPSKL